MVPVADEIVIIDQNIPAPAQPVEGLQFHQDLPGVFETGFAAVEAGDVTEFAVKGAAPRGEF